MLLGGLKSTLLGFNYFYFMVLVKLHITSSALQTNLTRVLTKIIHVFHEVHYLSESLGISLGRYIILQAVDFYPLGTL